MVPVINIGFDFRTDTPVGKDPDIFSPTLRQYHKLLWSKPLPGGQLFILDDAKLGAYLHHHSELGEFFLSSDSVIPTFSKWKRMIQIIAQFPKEEIEEFRSLGYTMGGMMIFPSNRVDGKNTINGARGFHHQIKDRMDLTLECIRRHYRGEASPLADVLQRYADFFALFDDFKGYVEFFLLQDLVFDGFEGIKFFMPFDDFKTSAVPSDFDAYSAYKDLVMEFIRRRNDRISSAIS